MHEKRYHGTIADLRDKDRVALLEVKRVVELSLHGTGITSVLDVGTGTGVFAEAFMSVGLDVEGIDVNPQMLREARAKMPQITFLEGTAESLPYSDATFDMVFMGLVLHETDDTRAAMKEASRVARRRVVVLEWPADDQSFGPPAHERLSADVIASLTQEAALQKPIVTPLRYLILYIMEKPFCETDI